MSDQTWKTDSRPRWKIWKWDSGQNGVKGPPIYADGEGLVGMDWVEAATVEVMPVSEHEALRSTLSSDISTLMEHLAWAMEYIDEPEPGEEPGNHAKFHAALKLIGEER